MKFFFQISIPIFTIMHFFCSSVGKGNIDGEDFKAIPIPEGWDGLPSDKFKREPYDYYYKKIQGKGDPKILKKNGDMKEIYKEFVIKNESEDLVKEMIQASISEISFNIENKIVNILFQKYKKEKVNVRATSCLPFYPDDPNKRNSGWREFECILYLHVPGGRNTIIQEAIEIQKMNL